MSIINKARAACTKCGNTNEITIYRSINISENPELERKVMDGSLFVWECPHCGTVNLARYETLYHDPEGKLMVWLLPDGDLPESQMKSISLHTKAMGGYTLRRVNDTGSLMEKVLISKAGLDDVVIEMCKYVTKMEIAAKMDKEKASELFSANFHFYKTEGEGDDRIIVLTYPWEERMVGARIGWNVYEDCAGILQRNPVMRPEEGFVRIDADWLYSKMK